MKKGEERAKGREHEGLRCRVGGVAERGSNEKDILIEGAIMVLRRNQVLGKLPELLCGNLNEYDSYGMMHSNSWCQLV